MWLLTVATLTLAIAILDPHLQKLNHIFPIFIGKLKNHNPSATTTSF